jgi:hypothetical protein
MHVTVFSTLAQSWLVSIQSSWRGRPETATGCLLLPQSTQLIFPHAKSWQVSAVAAPLLHPRICRRWEALAVVILLLLPYTRGGFIGWRSGDVGGLRHRSSSSTPGASSSDTPASSSSSSLDNRAGGFIRWLPLGLLGRQRRILHVKVVSSYIWTTSRFQLFSRITKCVHVHFQNLKLEKIAGSHERTSVG